MFILPDADFADDAEERRSFIVSNMPNFEHPTNKEKYNNPLFGRFSISSEILIDFGLTLFMVLPLYLTPDEMRCRGHSEIRAI